MATGQSCPLVPGARRDAAPYAPRSGTWPAEGGETGLRDVLRHRDLRLLLAGQAVSQAGDWLYNVALIVYILDATGSAAWVAAVELAHLVPWIVMSPIGGLMADRIDRRRLLIAGDLVQVADRCSRSPRSRPPEAAPPWPSRSPCSRP